MKPIKIILNPITSELQPTKSGNGYSNIKLLNRKDLLMKDVPPSKNP